MATIIDLNSIDLTQPKGHSDPEGPKGEKGPQGLPQWVVEKMKQEREQWLKQQIEQDSYIIWKDGIPLGIKGAKGPQEIGVTNNITQHLNDKDI